MPIGLNTNLRFLITSDNPYNIRKSKRELIKQWINYNNRKTIKDLINKSCENSWDEYYGPTQIISYLEHKGLLDAEVLRYKIVGDAELKSDSSSALSTNEKGCMRVLVFLFGIGFIVVGIIRCLR